MNFRDKVVAELSRLKLMGDRVPFTHHHDYVRLNADEAKFMSRSDVAQLDASEEELYACAFLQAVEGLTTEQKVGLGISQSLFYECLKIAFTHLANIDTYLKITRYLENEGAK